MEQLYSTSTFLRAVAKLLPLPPLNPNYEHETHDTHPRGTRE